MVEHRKERYVAAAQGEMLSDVDVRSPTTIVGSKQRPGKFQVSTTLESLTITWGYVIVSRIITPTIRPDLSKDQRQRYHFVVANAQVRPPMSARAREPGSIRQAWYRWKALKLPWRRQWLCGTKHHSCPCFKSRKERATYSCD